MAANPQTSFERLLVRVGAGPAGGGLGGASFWVPHLSPLPLRAPRTRGQKTAGWASCMHNTAPMARCGCEC
jgi:hypothetical protein